jgi:proteasome lid subunit RPN8/RPN11
MMVQLPQHIYDEIIAHAREGKPEEICGILRGRGMVAYELFRGRNIAHERVENYEVDEQTLLLQFKFENTGDEMMGVYHSHPVSVAYPSATDAWNATYPDSIYLICSLEHDDAPVIRAFRMITHFLAVDVTALKIALSFYETRPHLFAYYQSAKMPIPPALQTIAKAAPVPFYVVYYEEDGEVEARVVSLYEHPITISMDAQ